MFKTMVSFGITETVQVSASVPIAMSDGLGPARMMSAMSSEREFEALVAYRFQRRTVGIGGRQESTLYVGGTAPMESTRAGASVGPSLVVQAATGMPRGPTTRGRAAACSISPNAMATSRPPRAF